MEWALDTFQGPHLYWVPEYWQQDFKELKLKVKVKLNGLPSAVVGEWNVLYFQQHLYVVSGRRGCWSCIIGTNGLCFVCVSALLLMNRDDQWVQGGWCTVWFTCMDVTLKAIRVMRRADLPPPPLPSTLLYTQPELSSDTGCGLSAASSTVPNCNTVSCV